MGGWATILIRRSPEQNDYAVNSVAIDDCSVIEICFFIHEGYLLKIGYYRNDKRHEIRVSVSLNEIDSFIYTRNQERENLYAVTSRGLVNIFNINKIGISTAISALIQTWYLYTNKTINYYNTLDKYIINSTSSLVDKSAYAYVTHSQIIHSWLPDDIRKKCVWIRDNIN